MELCAGIMTQVGAQQIEVIVILLEVQCAFWSYADLSSKSVSKQMFCKGLDQEYFRLYWPFGLCWDSSVLPLQCGSRQR